MCLLLHYCNSVIYPAPTYDLLALVFTAYPESPTVTGVRIDRISTTSFRVRWLPAPFSVGYTVVVSEIGGRTRRFQYIRKIQVRDISARYCFY